MKKLYALFGVLVLLVVFLSLPPTITAQFPLPIWRNLFTTNTNPRILAGDATMNVSSNAATGVYTLRSIVTNDFLSKSIGGIVTGPVTFNGTNYFNGSNEFLLNRIKWSSATTLSQGNVLGINNTYIGYVATSITNLAEKDFALAVSNQVFLLRTTNNIAGALSNVVCNMDVPGLEITVTNNITLTNWVGCAAGTTKSKTIWLQVTNGGPWSVAYPADGSSHAVYWSTNCPPQANRPYTSVTNGSTYVLSVTARGTNLYASMTEWK